MSSSPYLVARERWCAQIDAIAASGYYSSRDRAHTHFLEHIAPAWRARLGVASTINFTRELQMTPAILMMVHLCVAGYRRIGASRGAPRFRHWPPHVDRDGTIRFFHAFPIRDVSKLTGVSVSALRAGVKRIRGRTEKGQRFRVERLMGAPPLPSGLLLDVVLGEANDELLRFSFAYEDYVATSEWSRAKGVDDGPIREYAAEWSTAGIKAIGRVLCSAPSNDVRALNATGTEGGE